MHFPRRTSNACRTQHLRTFVENAVSARSFCSLTTGSLHVVDRREQFSTRAENYLY
jgi:hypothetical protein